MKGVTFILMGGVFFLLAMNSRQGINLATESVSIMDAEKQQIIKTAVTSKGKYSGECMNLKVSNLQSKAAKILVPAGTVFIADNSGEQNILVTHDLMVELKPKESKIIDMTGYCCEVHDAAPDEGSTFKTAMHSDEKVIKLLEFLKDKSYTNGCIQDAVWCVANGSPVSNVYLEDEKQHKELRKFLCDLTGQKEVWYTSHQDYTLGADRRINSNPVRVTGVLKAKADKPMHIHKEVYNSENELLHSMGKMYMPISGEFEYEFKITVQGWEKGKYYVVVKGGDKELLRQEFEI